MSHATCKRIWEGTLGIAISPRKKRSGDYFWSFSFVRAFRRTRESNWEYVQHFGQHHAKALGTLMSKAFQFMEQNDPGQFVANAMAEATSSPPPVRGGRLIAPCSFKSATGYTKTATGSAARPAMAAAGPVVHDPQVKVFSTPLFP